MKESKDFFWPSYVDLMTALFLTMLVMFVLSYKLFKDKQRDNDKLIYDLKVQVQEKRKLDEIKAALKRLESDYFIYNQRYKRYELNFPVTFAPQSAVLPRTCATLPPTRATSTAPPCGSSATAALCP